MTSKALIWSILQIDSARAYNSFLYYLQKIPWLGRKIPNRWFKTDDIKGVVLFIRIIFFFLRGFGRSIGYVLYCYVLSFFVRSGMKQLNILPQEGFTLTLTLMVITSLLIVINFYIKLIEPNDMQQTHMIRLFRIEPSRYFQSAELLEASSELFFRSLSFGIFFHLNHFAFWHGLTFALFLAGSRLGIKVHCLPLYGRGKDQENPESLLNILFYLGIGIGVFLSLFFLLLGKQFSPYPFFSWYTGIAGLIIWLVSYYRLKTYSKLNHLTYLTLTHETMKEKIAKIDNIELLGIEMKDRDINVSELSPLLFENLSGISYLNAIFLKRMSRYLQRKILVRLAVLSVLFGIELLFLLFFKEKINIPMNEHSFSKFLFLSAVPGYLIYIGESYSKFCFYHLDRPLLRYNFYRERENILATLKIRFLYSIKLNFPIFVALNICFGTYYFNFFTPKIDQIIILVITQAISMILFSFYFLYLYFFLQPFTEGLKSKSAMYNILTFIIYYMGYKLFTFTKSITMPILLVSLGIIVVILIIGYLAVVVFTPKTFRLKS
ncbi:TPA: hypothetical protein ACINWA_000971 [Streptococcus agalactiae]